MSDEENTQPTPEPATPPVENPTPNQSSQSSDDTGQVSEPNSIPVGSNEPTAEVPVPPIESVPAPESPGPTETTPSPENAILGKDQNPANEPLNEPPTPEILSEPNNPNVTIERHGTDTTITEVMEPTAQMAGNEPFDKTQDKPIDLAKEEKTKRREENLKLANQTRQDKKRKKIDAILDLFAKQTNLTNDEVEKLLHVSDATATRYLETLEKEGKIKQVGKTGKGVMYEKI